MNTTTKTKSNQRLPWTVVAMVAGVVFAIGYLVGNVSTNSQDSLQGESTSATEYTCSMHPSIRQPEPGDCPICGMDLIPATGSEGANPNAVALSASAIARAKIATVEVVAGAATETISAFGFVRTDATKEFEQTSHIGGRIETVAVSSVGDHIRKGQIIAEVYSPALATAQHELLESLKRKHQQPELYEAAKRKLRNWKLTAEQISSIEETQEVITRFPLRADYSGVVESLNVATGDHVREGEVLFSVSQLSSVWIEANVDVSHSKNIAVGDSMHVRFSGDRSNSIVRPVTFLSPTVNAATNTVIVRAEANNARGQLRPGLPVQVSFSKPGSSKNKTSVLVVPSSAVLWTGPRSVVYVAQENSSGGVDYELRVVQTTGVRNGDQVFITHGLVVGEKVVAHGAFVIDASAELEGKPSMMSIPIAQLSPKIRLTEPVRRQLTKVVNTYLMLSQHLYNDKEMPAYTAANALKSSIATLFDLSQNQDQEKLVVAVEQVHAHASRLQETTSIATLRDRFEFVSSTLIQLLEAVEPLNTRLYEQYCPMVHGDTGAAWLSDSPDVLNPYFGSEMLQCGEVVRTID